MSAEFTYGNPLTQRYASSDMSYLFSDEHRYRQWRRLWVVLAEAQKKLGLPITQAQIDELKAHEHDLNLEQARKYELRFKHDVMAHIHAYGDQCPTARPIIHLGATSCYVTDNADVLLQAEALRLIEGKLVQILFLLRDFAHKYRSIPCLGQTHLQPAQPTTVGKRACLWLQDFLLDLRQLQNELKARPLLGVKGATGTQSSLVRLFNHDLEKVVKLDKLIVQALGSSNCWLITGQTYPRKMDSFLGKTLSGIAVSAHKFATDVRILSSQGELFETSSSEQIGSSAMPHKQNPIFSERVCSLARFAMSLVQNVDYTAALQWLERSLDDSANRRLTLPQLFLSIDAVLHLVAHIVSHLDVDQEQIQRRLDQHLPSLALEQILMLCVSRGADRQDIHERLRQHSRAAEKTDAQSLLERIAQDKHLSLSDKDMSEVCDPSYLLGMADQQVGVYLKSVVEPALDTAVEPIFIPPASY